MTSTASPNSFAWRTPFWPVVASTVISVSCGASGICLVITRRTLVSSAIRSVCVCRRPAVSMITTSAPRSRPRAIASKATAPGSEPSGPLTTSHAGALAPALELLDGGGAERVGGADHDLLAERLAQVPGELADRGRLAGAVDADDEDHGRVGAQVDRVVAGAGELGEQLGEALGQRLAADELALLGLALELLDDLRRSCGRRRRRRSAPPRAAPRSPRRGRPRTASPGPRPASASRVLRMFSRRRRKKPRRCSSRSGSARPARGAAPSVMKRSYQSRATGRGRIER